MSRLVLSLLGPFQAILDGVPVTTFESDKVRALLAYLAVEHSRPQRRETLAGLLWPDMPERDARANLRHVLANLRKVLGDRAAAQPFLLISHQTLQFNVDSDYHLDVQAFTDAIAATVAHSHAGLDDCETCIACLREAAGLYNGDFLAGFSLDTELFEAWITTQREKLHIRVLDVLDHLATYHEQRGDYAEVISYAQRQVDLEPWRESAHRQWMHALVCSGQRGMALAQYETCRRILETELGIEPEAATTTLCENIRCGDLQPPVRPLPDTQSTPTPHVSLTLPLPPAPEPELSISHTLTPALEGERRVVTLLMADLQGTAALTQLDTEAWAELITPALHLLGAEISRLGGNVEQYHRAGLMACFGGQVAHEDDPERAILAALAMREALAAYSAERDTAKLSLTVSVHTGEVICTPIGETTSMMGPVVESAAAIQASLTPGTIWVSAATHRLVAPLFTWASLAENGYEPLAYRPQVDKGRGIAGLFSPLVGRDREFHALEEAVARVRAGLGGIVTVVGEAGIGKSRLVAEIKRSAISDQPSANLQWIEGRCLSYATNVAYQVWLDMLRAWLDAAPDADPAAVRATLRARVERICPDAVGEVYPFLIRLLSLPPDTETTMRLRGVEASGLQVLTFRAVEMLIESAAQRQPLILVCEDLHWCDPTSLALLEQLLALVDRSALLLICIFRPEREHACWRIYERALREYAHRHTDVRLEALSTDESRQLLDNLLMIQALPPDLQVSILKRAEGNPFYIEEVLRTLINAGSIVYDDATKRWQAGREDPEHALPDTLQGLLLARIDLLPPGAKRVLQFASVIGRIFSYTPLAANLTSANLDAHLLTLQRAQLIREHARLPEREYIFQHQLTLEAAYSSLLRRARRSLHRRVAETLERLYPEHIEENLGILAQHWEEAGEIQTAVHYWQRAGEQAAAQYANREAINHLSHALELTPADDIAEKYSLLLTREKIHHLQAQRDLQAQDLAALMELAEQLDTNHPQAGHSRQSVVQSRYTHYFGQMGQVLEQRAAAKSAVSLAQAVHDVAGETLGYALLGHAFPPKLGLPYVEQALILSRTANLPEVEALTLHYLCIHYSSMFSSMLPDSEKALEYSQQQIHLGQEIGDQNIIGRGHRTLGVALRNQGKMAQALPHLEQGLQIARTVGNQSDVTWSLFVLGRYYFKQRQYARSEKYFKQTLTLLQKVETDSRYGKALTLSFLLRIAQIQGQPEKGIMYWEQALHYEQMQGEYSDEGDRYLDMASFLKRYGRYAEAQDFAKQALHIYHRLGDRLYEGWALWHIGQLYFFRGEYDIANDYAQKSLAIASDVKDSFLENVCLILLAFNSQYQVPNVHTQVEKYGQHALALAQEMGYSDFQGVAYCVLGHVAASIQHWEKASQAYTESLTILQTSNKYDTTQPFVQEDAIEAQSALAYVTFLQGVTTAAMILVEEILAHLQQRPLLGDTYEPLRVYFTCYQILHANADPRAQDILNTAYTMIQERAVNIEEESLRRSYLENVPHHRELVAEWKRMHTGASRGQL